MSDAPTPPAAAATEAKTTPNPMLQVSPAFSSLGSTTATRSWVAISAVILVMVAGLAWGLLGTVTLQQTVGGVSVGAGITYEVATPKAGIVTNLAPVGHVYEPGHPLATVRPDDGGPDITVPAPARLQVQGWDVVLGSPVQPGAPIGRGALIDSDLQMSGLSTKDPIVAVTFVPQDYYEEFANAVGIEVTIPNMGGTPKTYAAKLVSFSAYPSSIERIAQVTGNQTFAEQVTQDTAGETYMVTLGYVDPADAEQVQAAAKSGDKAQITTGQIASIVITKVSSNPLRVLFGSGS